MAKSTFKSNKWINLVSFIRPSAKQIKKKYHTFNGLIRHLWPNKEENKENGKVSVFSNISPIVIFNLPMPKMY